MGLDAASYSETLSKNPKCKIKDPERLRKRLSAMQEEGANQLMIMADFDFTITKRWFDNEKKSEVPSSFGVVKQSSLVDEVFRKSMQDLFHKYWPIETDPDMTMEKKTPFIEEWIAEELKLLKAVGLTEVKLCQMISDHTLVYRDEFPTFCSILQKSEIPMVVSTAGLADVVKGALKGWGFLSDNISILGNYFAWDPKSKLVTGFRDEVVHTQNKEKSMKTFLEAQGKDQEDKEDPEAKENQGVGGDEEVETKRPRLSSQLRVRPNILIMGDSLGDARMALELSQAQNVIKVGFLNDKNPESKMTAFTETFDIVLMNDDSMEVPVDLVKLISNHL